MKQQCIFANYPQNLERIEYMNFVSGGDFHVADFYTINHNTPNVISFTPKTEGVIKILVQAPQDTSESIKGSDGSDYEIEIVLYDLEEGEVVARALNAKMSFSNQDLKGDTDYSLLEFKVKKSHLSSNLMIVFQAQNYIEEVEEREDCLEVFIELQYSSVKIRKSEDLKLTSVD